MHKPLASFTQLLIDINYKLEPGITASLVISNGNVFLQYSVRAQAKGKRNSLGMFFTHSGAQDALWSFKRSGRVTLNEQEIAARSDVAMLAAGVTSAVQDVKLVEDDNNEFIAELLEHCGKHSYELGVSGTAMDLVDKDGTIHRLTPAIQSAYLEWTVRQWEATQEVQSEVAKPHVSANDEQEQAADEAIDPATGKRVSELTEAEYDAYMGLDD